MTEFAFTLMVRGTLNEQTLDALYGAGCGDIALSGDEQGALMVDVVRPGTSHLQLVLEAIRQIESVPGFQVKALALGEH